MRGVGDDTTHCSQREAATRPDATHRVLRAIYFELAPFPEEPPTTSSALIVWLKRDGTDFFIWQRQFGEFDIELAADGDGNRMVDGEDLEIWKMHFGTTGGSASSILNSAALPEPTSILMLFAGALVSILGHARRR
jgi:hypothetical protein